MFDARSFIEKTIISLKDEIEGNAIAACSGGVDSTTAAMLAYRAIGGKLKVAYIDDGFRRENEAEETLELLKTLFPHVIYINAQDTFYKNLKGIRDAEEKRKIFRETFYSILSEVAKKEKADYLVQGTIKADIDETVKRIKSQHNVLEQIGISTQKYGFKLVEPLKDLYKPQVRMVARQLGLPKEISEKIPFPGPGLMIRVQGEISPEKIEIVRRANKIIEEEVKDLEFFQAFAVLLEGKTTGTKDGKRVYGYSIALRIVDSEDALTAKAKEVPFELLKKIASRITSEIPKVNRVFYDITDKPPSTIEIE